MTAPDQPPDPALGLYGPGSVAWKVGREAVILGAGPCALLLQIAHPLVAQGVAQHSRFEEDPFGRLRSTIRTTFDIVFGDLARAERAVRRLNGIHAQVRGPVDDPVARAVGGDRYRALDPALLLWVQATLVWTSIVAFERWVGPLTRDERERYWWETRQVGARLGTPLHQSPVDWAAFERYWDSMLAHDGPVRVSPTARGLAPAILRPPFPFVPGPVTDLLALPAISILPERIREEFDLPWGAGRGRLVAVGDRVLRLYVNTLPRSWRSLPQARAAERRVRLARITSLDAETRAAA